MADALEGDDDIGLLGAVPQFLLAAAIARGLVGGRADLRHGAEEPVGGA